MVVQLLSLLAYALLCPLCFLGHARSVSPSTTITIFLMSSICCDILGVGLLDAATKICGCWSLEIATFIAKVVLLVLESCSKRRIIRERFRSISMEETSGLLGTTFFWWVNEFIALGYSKVLSCDDMPPLPSYLDSQRMRERMIHFWKRECEYNRFFSVLRCLT